MTQADSILVGMAEKFGQPPSVIRSWPVSDVALVLKVWKSRAEESKREEEFDELKAQAMFGQGDSSVPK